MNAEAITGIVLAGGRSSRMGTDKALLIYLGIPLIRHATDILKTVCSRVVISANNDKYGFTGCEFWPDEFVLSAPMIGIYSCLNRSETEWNIVLSCDMPRITPEILNALLAAREACDMVLPVHDAECIEPLCAAYNKRLIPSMRTRIESRKFGLRSFAQQTNHTLVRVSDESALFESGMFININTAADFDLLSRS